MLCRYSTGMDYVGGLKAMSHGGRIMVSNSLLGYNDDGGKTEKNDKILAGNLAHEGCHNMMHSIMGGYGKTIGQMLKGRVSACNTCSCTVKATIKHILR